MGTQFKSCGSSENLREQFNALRDDVEAVRAKVNAIILAADTNIGAVAALDDVAAMTSADLTED